MIVDLSNQQPNPVTPIYAWTDLTYLWRRAGVSWGYYVVSVTEPDCRNPAEIACAPVKQQPTTFGITAGLRACGANTSGQLGNGATTNPNTVPVKVTGLS